MNLLRHDVSKYTSEKYEDITRWISYYHQIHEILSCAPVNVLEIGKGSGLVSTVLRSRNVNIMTLDVNPKLDPDIVASVTNMPIEDRSFDLTLCAEVLEHLPFEDFKKALFEIRRVTRKNVVLSLPHWGWVFDLNVKVPMIPRLRFFWKLSGWLKHPSGEVHFWEIGKRGYPLRRIEAEIRSVGFRIDKSYIDPRSPYHRFFLLTSTQQ